MIHIILNLFFFLFVPQLEESGIKPRPGSDVSNINAPSPPHKVQWEHITSPAYTYWGLLTPAGDECNDLTSSFSDKYTLGI